VSIERQYDERKFAPRDQFVLEQCHTKRLPNRATRDDAPESHDPRSSPHGFQIIFAQIGRYRLSPSVCVPIREQANER
jgi:hypothetical protein